MIIPEGILYDKEKGACRTLEVNETIAEIARRSGDLAIDAEGTYPFLSGKSLSAEKEGFEWRGMARHREFTSRPTLPVLLYKYPQIFTV